VIVVQAEGGRALAAKHPDQAPAVLATIAETSREALEEMRKMVGLLRSGGAEPEQVTYRPTPGLTDLAELVRKTSDTAEFTAFGTVPRVSPALGLSAYRVVQESLTNVLKHAGPRAAARVTVAYTADSIEIEISDNGRGDAASPDRLGHGLQGMRERVALHGGSMSAEPRPGVGFVVRVWLPYASEPSAPRPLEQLRPAR
jgi:signal transduction histidine kinase